ncbi:hypothetical protein B0H16DRAFT_1742110 [Mycena metata]|uniref:Uncharacterized protein n=1 Tax=Mycena metata TaxID=1033252 RepID=A0AAD7H8U6_9AGAR|nr:hypothetical protein B0H16DRAFT_1742110 [Mycena metata]
MWIGALAHGYNKAAVLTRELAKVLPELAGRVLRIYSDVLYKNRNYQGALDAASEGESLMAQGEKTPTIYTSKEYKALTLCVRAQSLAGLDRLAKAAGVITEALKLYQEELASPKHGTVFNTFPWVVRQLLPSFTILGPSDETLALTLQLVDMARALEAFVPGKFQIELQEVLEFHAKLSTVGRDSESMAAAQEAASVPNDS